MWKVFNQPGRGYAIILHDLLMVAVAWLGAWWLRFNLGFPFENWPLSLYVLPLVLLIQGVAMQRFGLYRGLWRFSSLPDLWNIARAALVGGLCITLALFMWLRLEGIPRSVLALYPLLLVLLLGGPRLLYRIGKDRRLFAGPRAARQKALVVGAGAAGELLIRDLLRTGGPQPVAIVDDAPGLRGAEIHGLAVCGGTADLPRLAPALGVDMILIAIPSTSGAEMRAILRLAQQTGCAIRTLPGMRALLTGKVTFNALREVRIEDLLGRERVRLDHAAIHAGLDDQCVLVTGGGGSIGAELCRQIAGLSPARLIIIDHSEYNLYRIEQALAGCQCATEFLLDNVCDLAAMEKIMARCQPRIIFHAAAYKHVPLLERQPRQAIRNNILGARNMAIAAGRHQAQKFVLISTDKAVNPANVLGASKRVAELYTEIQNAQYPTRYLTVRFGNVLDSEGSVVPLFRRQIKAGGPVTVTHPDISRYFMTIAEACQLIMQACVMGRGGEIFVLDMGEPVKIRFLAEQMIRLSGRRPGEDIQIDYTGLRAGEKLHEELFYAGEGRQATAHKKIFMAQHAALDQRAIGRQVEALLDSSDAATDEALAARLRELVAAYSGENKANVIPLKEAGAEAGRR